MNSEDSFSSNNKMRFLYSSQVEMPLVQSSVAQTNGSMIPTLSSAALLPYPTQMSRKKTTWKRSATSLEQSSNVDYSTLKKEVAALLHDVPNHILPLFKFREMFERRYRRSVSSYDLYRMRDVVNISESSSYSATGTSSCSSGRNISLCQEWAHKQDDVLLFCKLHPPKGYGGDKGRTGWAEKEVTPSLPNVMIELKTLATRTHSMLQSHNGTIPLLSFLDCYEFAFGAIELAEEGNGVPLEHLITCVQGVEIGPADNGMKQVQWSEKKEPEPNSNIGMTQPQAIQMAQLSRELVDLLKTFPRCCLPFSKLIPAYHHHFGRQCRVADYGHATLSSLLKTLPGTIQVMGENQNRVLTLAHRAQMKRFATDVLRVLKSQGGPKKEVRVEDFAMTFSQVYPTRVFSPEDYGLCYVTDLVQELVESSTLVALLKDENGSNLLAIPKREQTPQEMHKTRIFATEVFDLLRHSIRCEMPFSKFIPAYHHHFGRQCRVADYGFSKLAELFEAITDTVVAVNPNNSGTDCSIDDKILRLTPKEQLKVVGEQTWSLVEKRNKMGQITTVDDLDELYLSEYGFRLRPELCEAEDIRDLLENKLSHFITVEGDRLFLVDRAQVEQLVQDAKSILENQPDSTMELQEFMEVFQNRFQRDIDLSAIRRDLAHIMLITQDENDKHLISLAPMRVFAKEIVELLEDVGGYIPVPSFEAAYLQKFGRPVRPAQMGFPSLAALLQAIPDVVSIRGTNRTKRLIVLNNCPPAVEKRHTRWKHHNASSSAGPKHSSSGPGPCGGKGGNVSGEATRWPPNKWRNAPMGGMGNPVIPSQIYSPTPQSPVYMQRASESIFSFDRPAQMSPPVYDMWMRDTGTPASPPMSPPMVWTYHPIMYPPTPASPVTPNIMMPPQFQFGHGPWSPPATQMMMYEQRVPPQPVTNPVNPSVSSLAGTSSCSDVFMEPLNSFLVSQDNQD